MGVSRVCQEFCGKRRIFFRKHSINKYHKKPLRIHNILFFLHFPLKHFADMPMNIA